MTSWRTTQALRIALPEMSVLDYGADADFNKLWRMELGDRTDIIVVWADTPADPDVYPVNTEPFVTPFDWAMAACALNTALRVTVVDLRPADHDRIDLRKDRDGNDFEEARYAALRWLTTQKKESVLWLRRLAVGELLTASDIDNLCSWIDRKPAETECGKSKLLVTPRDALRALPLCQVDITGKDDHHSIANLIGPLLLVRKGFGDSKATPDHRLALRKTFEAAGFISPLAQRPAGGAGDEPDTPPLPLGNIGPIRFVLVDDQWHHGWAEWIAERLALKWEEDRIRAARLGYREGPQCVAGDQNSGPSLWVSSDPQWLLQRATDAKGEGKDARFKLRLTDDSEAPEILLLDLRLFPLTGDEGKNFAKKVAEAAQLFVGSGAWAESFEKIELAAIMEGKKGHKFDTAALTLLPRFLSLADFSLPIILFSSTGRRDIMGRLRSYGSVFPQFAKPRLLGEAGSDIRERSDETLGDAINAALHWAAARKLCLKIISAADTNHPVMRTLDDQYQHFELYIDESGSSVLDSDPGMAPVGDRDKRFFVGGLLVAYRNQSDYLALKRKMEDAGLLWWHSDTTKTCLPHHATPEKREEILSNFLKCSNDNRIFGLCLEHQNDAWAIHSLIDPAYADNRYRATLSTLIEAVIFDVLPVIAASKSTLSIFTATRARHQDEFEDGAIKINEIRERFGNFGGANAKGRYYNSFAQDSLLPLVIEILERRGNESNIVGLANRLKAIRGVLLAYSEDEKASGKTATLANRWSGTRHQHYIADIVAGLCRNRGQQFDWPGYQEVFKQGFYDQANSRLMSALGAARKLSFEDRSGAILELASFDFVAKLRERSAIALILNRLAAAIRHDLTGADFAALAQEAQPQEQLRSRPVPLPSLSEAHQNVLNPGLASSHDAFARVAGNIKFFNSQKGWGFISRTGAVDVYFQISAWRGADEPRAKMAVEFVAVLQARGWKASDVWPCRSEERVAP